MAITLEGVLNFSLANIKSLLKDKDAEGLEVYLEGLKATEEGLAFERFLELLYNGNGYTAVRHGGIAFERSIGVGPGDIAIAC